jgi:hypothetical protein
LSLLYEKDRKDCETKDGFRAGNSTILLLHSMRNLFAYGDMDDSSVADSISRKKVEEKNLIEGISLRRPKQLSTSQFDQPITVRDELRNSLLLPSALVCR